MTSWGEALWIDYLSPLLEEFLKILFLVLLYEIFTTAVVWLGSSNLLPDFVPWGAISRANEYFVLYTKYWFFVYGWEILGIYFLALTVSTIFDRQRARALWAVYWNDIPIIFLFVLIFILVKIALSWVSVIPLSLPGSIMTLFQAGQFIHHAALVLLLLSALWIVIRHTKTDTRKYGLGLGMIRFTAMAAGIVCAAWISSYGEIPPTLLHYRMASAELVTDSGHRCDLYRNLLPRKMQVCEGEPGVVHHERGEITVPQAFWNNFDDQDIFQPGRSWFYSSQVGLWINRSTLFMDVRPTWPVPLDEGNLRTLWFHLSGFGVEFDAIPLGLMKPDGGAAYAARQFSWWTETRFAPPDASDIDKAVFVAGVAYAGKKGLLLLNLAHRTYAITPVDPQKTYVVEWKS
jgi:hypothetical protein